MKIQVKSKDMNLNLPVPTGMIFSPSTLKVLLKAAVTLKRNSRSARNLENKMNSLLSQLPPDALDKLNQEIKRLKKVRGDWDLLEVSTESGDQVLIRM